MWNKGRRGRWNESYARRCFLQAAVHTGNSLAVPLAVLWQIRHVGSVLQCKTWAHAAVMFLLHNLCCFPSFLSPLTPACSQLAFSFPPIPCPPVPSFPRASSGTCLLWPREERDGRRGWQVTWVEPGTSRIQPQKHELVGQDTALGGQDWGRWLQFKVISAHGFF